MESINISDIEFSDSSHTGVFKKVILSGSEMSSSVTQVAYAELKMGEVIEEHSHNTMEEVFLVLEGNCEFYLNGVSNVLFKNCVIKIPPRIKHKLKAITDTKLYYFGVSI